jgi:DNA-binding MarR family transcriptional regulator
MAVAGTTSRRLTSDELVAWAGFLRVHGEITHALDADLAAHGISLSDYDVLVFLANAPERRLRMSELAESVLITQSGITRLVDRLVARGLVERQRCSEDRRGSFAVLTDRGVTTLDAARGRHLDGVRERFLDRLHPDDLAALAAAWERLSPGLAERLSRLRPPPGC